jgi:hypothetical protein
VIFESKAEVTKIKSGMITSEIENAYVLCKKTVAGVLVTLGLLGCDQKTAFVECFEHKVEEATERGDLLSQAKMEAGWRCRRGIKTSDDLRLCTRAVGRSEEFSLYGYEQCLRD